MNLDALKNRILDSLEEWDLSIEERREVVFHLTDWMDDYHSLKKVFESPENLNDKEIAEILMQFLIHVPNHLAAASKIGLDIPVTDIFDVKSTTESDDSKAT